MAEDEDEGLVCDVCGRPAAEGGIDNLVRWLDGTLSHVACHGASASAAPPPAREAKPACGLPRLAREASAQRNKLLSSIRARKEHPSYGYSKQSILAEYHVLVGMCFSYLYASQEWPWAGSALLDGATNAKLVQLLDVDLASLWQQASTA